MATKTKATTKATTTKKAGTAKSKGTSTRAKATGKTAAKSKAAAAKQDGASKREAQRAQNDKLREQVVELRAAEMSWSDIANELSVTPGKAQFLMMQHEVSKNSRLKLRFKDDDELVTRIREAREANDAHSSWGWIAARTGVSEGKIKAVAEEAGIPVKGTNIAVSRSENNGGGKKADRKTRKQASTKATGKKSTGTKGKATAARKRAAKRAGKTSTAS